jgi:hypothetical protein
MIPHLLRCQGFAVVYYGFTLGRLGPGASSTFAQLRYNSAVKVTFGGTIKASSATHNWFTKEIQEPLKACHLWNKI